MITKKPISMRWTTKLIKFKTGEKAMLKESGARVEIAAYNDKGQVCVKFADGWLRIFGQDELKRL